MSSSLMIKRGAMRSTLPRLMLVFLFAAACVAVAPTAIAQQSQSPVIYHDLVVTLDPANHRLKVRDRIHIPGAFITGPFTISLNADLNVQAVSDGLKLVPVRSRVQGPDSGMYRDDYDFAAGASVLVNVYRVEGAMPGRELIGELHYEGVVNYAVRQSGGEYARAFSQSPGLIESRGVYLAGSNSLGAAGRKIL